MKKYLLPFILLFLGACALSGCSAGKSANAGTAQISSKNGGETYLMAGEVATNDTVDITSKVSARIVQINADVGTAVKKGDPLIELDAKDLDAQVAQAQAGVDIAQANLIKAQSGVPEQISKAQAVLDSTRTSYENAQSAYTADQQLYNAGVISKSQLEQSQTALAAAEAAYKSAKADLDTLNNGGTSETISVLKSQLEQAQAALVLARDQLNNATITSPISGVVSTVNVNAGELAIPGVTLITVVNTNALLVNAYLPAELRDRIKVGQEVVIEVSEIPDKKFDGVISVIDPVIDAGDNDILVKVNFVDQDPLLKPGMFAEIGLKN